MNNALLNNNQTLRAAYQRRQQRTRNRMRRIEKVAEEYELPINHTVLLTHHQYTGKRTMICKVVTNEDKSTSYLPIATPFSIFARLRRIDERDAYGLRIHVQDMKGECRVVDIDRAELGKSSLPHIMQKLYSNGLCVENDGHRIVQSLLRAVSPKHEVLLVSKSGWYSLPNEDTPFYVTPGGEVIGAPRGVCIELADNHDFAEPSFSGTLEGWREIVDMAVAIENVPHWRLGAMAGFAGIVQTLCGFDTCGLNLCGITSSGKTTALNLAISVNGQPRIGARLMRSWRTTDNAVELLATLFNGTVGALDELGLADGKAVGKVIYSISMGAGKSRMTDKIVDLQTTLMWRCFLLSSGEQTIEQRIVMDGGKYQAGMAVRIPDVDITGVNTDVDKDRVDAIKSGLLNHYGHAGVAFAIALVEGNMHKNPDAMRERINMTARAIIGKDGDGRLLRAAIPFAIVQVAGELACEFGILPQAINPGETVAWAWQASITSSDVSALDPHEAVLSHLRKWVTTRINSTIKRVQRPFEDVSLEKDHRVARLASATLTTGWYDDKCIYIPTEHIAKATGDLYSKQQIGHIFSEAGLIAKRKDARKATVDYVPLVGRVKCYALHIDQICDMSQDKDWLPDVERED